MNHLINSLKVEMECPNEGMAFEVRHHFAQKLQAEIIEVMGEICNKYSAENEWLRIDKLEIDIGQFDNTVFVKNFKLVFAKQFEKILQDKINKIPQAERKELQSKSLADAVRYFLLNGLLPWWVNKSDFDLNKTVITFLTEQEDAAKLFFIAQQTNQQLWQRTAFQLNNEAKEIVVQYISVLQSAKQLLLDLLQIIIQPFKIEMNDVAAKAETTNNLILKSATVFFAEPITTQLIATVLLNGLEDFFSKDEHAFNGIIMELKEKIDLENNAENPSNKIKSIKQDAENNLNLSKQENAIVEVEKYLVQQAGIVLLSPFFKPFFTNLKLLENGDFISQEAKVKAVHLLHFISTGLQEVVEYNVTLEKVLCGLPIPFPVPLKINLTTNEIEECNSVITSTIEHWSVLKSTSVQGFRQTFLQREAILKPLENSWLLQVERKTLDVLLEKIPWGFNTIFLPWLNKLINVEW